VELMKKLIRYDPDERILSRQALKDPYFKDLRDSERDAKQPSAQQFQEDRSNRNARSSGHRDNVPVGMSASSSTGSIGPNSDLPEVTANASSRSVSPEERTGTLPSISQVPKQRKVAPSVTSEGGASQISGGPDGDAEDPDDGTLLPPIGAVKDKGHNKSKGHSAFKAAGASTLQKHTISNFSAHTKGSSKGFSGAFGVTGGMSTGMSAKSDMTPGSHQKWGGGKDPELTGAMNRSQPERNAAEKMNSTWAPNHQNARKFVSPFSHKLGGARSSKNR